MRWGLSFESLLKAGGRFTEERVSAAQQEGGRSKTLPTQPGVIVLHCPSSWVLVLQEKCSSCDSWGSRTHACENQKVSKCVKKMKLETPSTITGFRGSIFVIQLFRGLRQEDYRFEASMGFLVSPCFKTEVLRKS